MVDKEKVIQRLLKMEETINKLKQIAECSWEQYKAEEGLQDRAERNLQIAAQACIDIGTHVIADQGLRTPIGYGDVFVILSENGFIPEKLADNLKKMAGFRNILVHDYLDIDNKMVYQCLQNLDDLKEFAVYIDKLL